MHVGYHCWSSREGPSLFAPAVLLDSDHRQPSRMSSTHLWPNAVWPQPEPICNMKKEIIFHVKVKKKKDPQEKLR